MKKVLTIILLVLLTVGLFVSCNSDAIENLFEGTTPDNPTIPKYLCFTAEEAGSTVKLVTPNTLTTVPVLKYSTDGVNWEDLVINSTTITLTNVGDKVYLKGDNSSFSKINEYLNFTMTGKIAASGNIMSLLDSTCQSKSLAGMNYVFAWLFYNCTALTTAPELPATTLSDYCYSSMFQGCTSLTTAPALPAEFLTTGCYSSMFANCTALTNAPNLPAMDLAEYCYSSMFSGCTKLNNISVGFTSWGDNATVNWVKNVASSGTFVCPAGLSTENKNESHIPTGWIVKNPTFKAVYNTTGDANILTFYYDNKDHSGENITVYEGSSGDNYLFDNSKSNGAQWGYNDKRGEIKSVVIDASVADYKGLTSTAFMFQSMTIATNISGAEYLDVSNVTNMSYMFNNFGGGNTNSHTALNSVPNVSGWNTSNVTNMTAMFESYGNFSDNLAIVPDVSNWNTGKVTDMPYMFQKYGHESQNFNAVPDVSKWNTGNVTSMQQMFMEYGHKSTALNTVPNVSGWNTGKVTNMKQMFYGYGNTSSNISCVLDLSGWDLSKITGTNGVNVFNFNPKTFNVLIPAKTGETSNKGDKWYYGDGTNSIIPPTDKTFTLEFEYVEIGGVKWATKNLGAKKVTDYGDYFAWGETAPYYEGTGGWPATLTWKSGKESGYAWQSYCGSSSFSEWSTQPYDATTKILKPEFDAAAQILGNGWRMPTSDEFNALYTACLNGSYDTTTNPSGASASVDKGVYWCASYDGVAGCLFCDGTNKLFFPAVGDGSNTELSNLGNSGSYWSSSFHESQYALYLSFNNVGGFYASSQFNRFYACPIRPVAK